MENLLALLDGPVHGLEVGGQAQAVVGTEGRSVGVGRVGRLPAAGGEQADGDQQGGAGPGGPRPGVGCGGVHWSSKSFVLAPDSTVAVRPEVLGSVYFWGMADLGTDGGMPGSSVT